MRFPLEDSDIQIIRELISGAEMYIADLKYISLINEERCGLLRR